MNKNELITSASEISGISKKTTEEVVKATLTAIETALQNGETVKIPASKAPAFKAGKALKDAVNK